MTKLEKHDHALVMHRLPVRIKDIMTLLGWRGKIYVGGGFIRAVVSGERVNDIDLFVNSKKDAINLIEALANDDDEVIKTDNAFTIRCAGEPAIQVIYKWTFDKPEDVINSFDFTICCAVIYYQGKKFHSCCDPRFYADLAAKRLVYKAPKRKEAPAGSLMRVLKYFRMGYHIEPDSFGAVVARMTKGVKGKANSEANLAKSFAALMQEVTPHYATRRTATYRKPYSRQVTTETY